MRITQYDNVLVHALGAVDGLGQGTPISAGSRYAGIN
jgi:hypothetical protein